MWLIPRAHAVVPALQRFFGMKPPRRPLRRSPLKTTDLAKVHGGRGICHGWYECVSCGDSSDYAFDVCPNCGARFGGGRDA